MISFNQTEWRIFRRLQKKHKVSTEFLRYNLEHIQKIIWYETWPRIIIKRYAIRKRNRIFLVHYRLRRVLFDQANRKMLKRMRLNIRQWSKRTVAYLRRTQEVREYVEEAICEDKNANNADDVSRQLKEQLELLKSVRRQQPLIDTTTNKVLNEDTIPSADTDNYINANWKNSGEKLYIGSNKLQEPLRENTDEDEKTEDAALVEEKGVKTIPTQIQTEKFNGASQDWQYNLELTPEKQMTLQENVQPTKQLATDEKTERSQHEDESLTTTFQSSEKTIKSGLNFLDMLMSKVSAGQTSAAKTERKIYKIPSMGDVCQHEHSLDSTDEFLGFEDVERVPGMLMTPIVPNSTKNNKNSVFVSETLNEYMRENDLETDYNIDEDKSITRSKITHTDMEGLLTPKTPAPPFDMPAVPDNLLRFRTVAERKSYLQKFSKNYRLSIINNEASIYRELQKRIRYQKCKPSSQQISAQSANSAMSFTRNGWHAASFINTEFNKYYYQMIDVDGGKYKIRLKGVRGNNDEFRKKPYSSIVKNPAKVCPPRCIDEDIWHDLKAIKTVSPRTKKLNKGSLPSVFKPCPLSHKTFQKPLDDDAAALLLAGGSMAVVRMPTVELEVFPEFGRPLNEIAKRYLQYILPHHDISREWAEFSVSTLKLPGSLKDAVQAAADSIPRKSFTFLIPYLNDRNHVLVRRVVDRSEKLDQSFEHSLDSELVPKTDFTFRQNLDQSDDILITCADVVSDMINTVAISCSENSFIKSDPDMLSGENEIFLKSPTAVKTEKITRPSSAPTNNEAKKQSKQKRVLSELKRLNATIIDAAIKPEKDNKPCTKEYCTMGCVCCSLTEETHVREHCGKTKCMWECSCKSSNQSRIMRLETDGRTITTEDAFMLRRKATARLARMEKEFTSTVVLTENETLLINETNNDKKRRCTKVPKRYEYDDDTDEEMRKPSPKKTALTTIDNEKNLAVAVKELREPVYVKDTVLEQLKHCTVNLVRLENMENVAPWCMIHNLYKCFCKGRALEGKPMIIEKGENNTTIEHGSDEQQWEIDYKITAKARYTFEKVEKNKYKEGEDSDNDINAKYEPQLPNKIEHIENTHMEHTIEKRSKNDVSEHLVEKDPLSEECKMDTEKPKRSLEDVRERFYASRPECCRRQIPIPRRMFLYCNRKRRLNVLKYIKHNETEKTRLLLNEHVMRSVYYHKKDNERAKKPEGSQTNKLQIVAEKEEVQKVKESSVIPCSTKESEAPIVSSNIKDSNKNVPEVHEIVDLLDDDDEVIKSVNLTSNTIDSSSAELPVPDVTNNHSGNSNIADAITTNVSEVNVGVRNSSTPNNSSSSSTLEGEQLMVPKISNCFSLNAKAKTCKAVNSTTDEQKLQQHLADLTSATSVNSTAFISDTMSPSQTQLNSNIDTPIIDSQFPPNLDNESARDVYNNVIRVMNSLVSKKMQDVDFALKRESHIIPAPNTDILCIMKWSNFLDAYCQGFAYIWQVKSKEGTYMVATIRNMMPMICGAMGVVNITALKPERMPLMGRMLLHNVRNEQTTKLAVVMQGKPSYWVVKGFLKADPAMACNKPTPETHPSLTKKINVLCTSLVKQRQKDQKKKEQLMPKHPSQSINVTREAQIMFAAQGVPESSSKTSLLLGQPPQSPQTQNPLHTPHPLTTPTTTNATLTMQPQSYKHQQQQILPQNPTPPSPSYQLPQPVVPLIPASINPAPTSVPAKSNPAPVSKSTQHSRKRKPVGESKTNGTISNKMDSYSKMNTNIVFRKVTPEDVNEIHLPEVHKRNHKWLVLDLHNDFSHIFVPDFRDLVSLDRIQKVINFAKQKNKIVKLQFFQNAPFDAFVTPRSGKKIYFGPLNLDMKPPTLILLQSVDGQMMLRELYQLKHNIQKSVDQRTKAFWLLQMNGQTHFEIEPVTNKGMESITSSGTASAHSNGINNVSSALPDNDDDDDEDCMIIDEVANDVQKEKSAVTMLQPSQQQKAERYNFTIGTMPNDSTITITPQTNSLPGPPPIQTLMNSAAATSFNGGELPSLLKIPNTNTIIKPLLSMPLVNPSSSLLALPANTVISGISPINSTMANASPTVMTLPPNAVVTSITTAGQDTSYGSTIYISSSPAANTTNSQNIFSTPLRSDTNPSTMKQSFVPVTAEDDSPQQFQQGPAHKRRRVSVVCHNSYDMASQNIAVNAVINKILPDNVQDIQVNQSEGGLKSVSTIGSTTITKITDSFTEKQCPMPGQNKTSKPVVFDVSFVDGGDEPAASIVIKPTPSSTKTPTSTACTSATFPPPATMSNANSLLRENPKYNVKNSRNIPYKVVKVPSSMTAATTTGQTQILNRLLSTKANTSVTSTHTTAAVASSHSNSLLTKKVLNSTKPIKITSITSIPALKAPTKHIITNAKPNIKIAPKPNHQQQPAMESLKSATNPPISRSLTITQIPAASAKSIQSMSNTNTVSTVTPSAATTFKPTLPTSTSLTQITSTTTAPLSRLSEAATTKATTSTTTSSKTLNSTLAITSVQSFGSPQAQRNSSNTPDVVLPPHIQYGYIISLVYTDYKFVAKRVMEEFYVKVPSVGILKLMGLPSVHNYLNKHMLKISEKHTLPGDWKFVAASKAVQLQNHQKSLLVHKTKAATEIKMLPSRSSSLLNSKSDSNKTQKVVNATSMSEPILIDD